MSDDLPPVDGHVLPDDARRLAEGRTLVNLDAVDFASILVALELASTAARRLAATGAPELVFHFTDRWTELENILAAAGLTANAAWTYDPENENSRRRHEAWDYLRGLLLDVRTKYPPQDNASHGVLATRSALAVEMVQAVIREPTGARTEASTKTRRSGAPKKYPRAMEMALGLLAEGEDTERAIYRKCKEAHGTEERIPKIESFMRAVRRVAAERRGQA